MTGVSEAALRAAMDEIRAAVLPEELPRWVAETVAREGYPWAAPAGGLVLVRPKADRVEALWRECVRLLRESRPKDRVEGSDGG